MKGQKPQQLNSRRKKQTKHLKTTSLSSIMLLFLYSLLTLSSSFKQVRFYESLLAPQGNTLCIPRAKASTVSAHIQGKFILIFICMNIFLSFFSFFVGRKITWKSQNGFGGCAPGCGVEVESLEEIIRKGNCAQREEKSLCYPRWKILLLFLKVHARRATLLECLNINSSAG